MAFAFIFHSGEAPPGKLAGYSAVLGQKAVALSGSNSALFTEVIFPFLYPAPFLKMGRMNCTYKK